MSARSNFLVLMGCMLLGTYMWVQWVSCGWWSEWDDCVYVDQVWIKCGCCSLALVVHVLGFVQVSAHAKLWYFHGEWMSVLEWQTPSQCTTLLWLRWDMNWISFHWGGISGPSVLSTLTMSTVEEMDGARYTCSIKALSSWSTTHGQCRVQCYSSAYNNFIFIFRWLWCRCIRMINVWTALMVWLKLVRCIFFHII